MDFLLEGLQQAILLLLHNDASTFSAIYASLLSTSYAMVAAIIMGVPCGLILGYYSFPGRRFLRIISDTLLAFPTVLIGLIVYAFIMRRGPLGDLGLLFTLEGMAIGQAFLALPIIISLTAQSVESMDKRCKQTFLTLGASPVQLAWGTVSELRFELMLILFTAFGRVITEVGISMLLGGNIQWETRNITTFLALETNKGEFVSGVALGLVLLFIAFTINVFLNMLQRRGRP